MRSAFRHIRANNFLVRTVSFFSRAQRNDIFRVGITFYGKSLLRARILPEH